MITFCYFRQCRTVDVEEEHTGCGVTVFHYSLHYRLLERASSLILSPAYLATRGKERECLLRDMINYSRYSSSTMIGDRGKASRSQNVSSYNQPTLFHTVSYLHTSVTEFKYTTLIESHLASFDRNYLEEEIDYHFHRGRIHFSVGTWYRYSRVWKSYDFHS